VLENDMTHGVENEAHATPVGNYLAPVGAGALRFLARTSARFGFRYRFQMGFGWNRGRRLFTFRWWLYDIVTAS